MPEATSKPVKSFRMRGVRVSVFENHAERDENASAFHKVSIQKIYKQGNDFKTSTSLGRDDLPIARLLLDRAWQFILDAESNSKDES